MIRLLLAFLALLLPSALAAQGVVSSADPRATQAGQEILRQGGSAADAAMAMMLALTVVEPQSSGIGGGGFFVHHDAATGLTDTVDGREKAPMAATPERFLRADGTPIPWPDRYPGGLSVGVPGNIRLMERVHARWGKLPWAALFQPAIRLADQGFEVTRPLAGISAWGVKQWEDFPEIARLYTDDGRPLRQGQRIRNPALADLLRDIAKDGPDAFYTGETAREIVEAVAEAPMNRADMTLADLAAYEAKDRPAVCSRYREYKLCGMGPPSSGATTVFQILGMLERFDMKALGKDSPEAWHLIAEAMMLAYADREKYLGDRDFVPVPVAGLLDPGYMAKRSKLIGRKTSLASYDAGTPPGAEPRTAAVQPDVPGTTHFVAVDGEGDVVSMTSTVEGPFGSQLVARGLVLNNELTDFTAAPELNGAPVANRVQPGKRPLSSMSPTIVYDADNRPILALGSAGGKRIIMHVAKTLIGVLDWGLPAEAAIALPNIYFAGEAVQVEAGTPLAERLPELARFGRTVIASDLGSKVNAVERTADGWRGAADPRGIGTSLEQ
ncbi:gamma-glutamyltransferase [Sphingomonas gilva]|uniref:Glutathione hydrolase proenzyme n=1 Tax=Sphingomonas gilva TaxID=2305907 RepID=A0A396RSF3_9SPHN|nr:gamma-glutamyltransferase [Sphingomonas gilva]RHW18272.1 gamma-glutamyltransferase [Sphingomonas gilva]